MSHRGYHPKGAFITCPAVTTTGNPITNFEFTLSQWVSTAIFKSDPGMSFKELQLNENSVAA